MYQTIRWICKECKNPFEDWDVLDNRNKILFVEFECKKCERKINIMISIRDESI